MTANQNDKFDMNVILKEQFHVDSAMLWSKLDIFLQCVVVETCDCSLDTKKNISRDFLKEEHTVN